MCYKNTLYLPQYRPKCLIKYNNIYSEIKFFLFIYSDEKYSSSHEKQSI